MSRNFRIALTLGLLALAALACGAFGADPTATPQPTALPTATQPPSAAAQFGLATPADIEAYYQSTNVFHLEDFAAESYTQEEYNTPGTLVFTIEDPGATDVVLESSWCADTLDLALEDWQYMQTTFTINGEEIGSDYIYMDQWEPEDGGGCVSDSILVTEWPSGNHQLQVLIEQSQDLGNVPAGDYIWDYEVSVP